MEKYIISEEYLEKLLKRWANSLVGRTMKRFELTDDKEVIKKEVKELIYENVRDLGVGIRSFSYGVKFNNTPKQ